MKKQKTKEKRNRNQDTKSEPRQMNVTLHLYYVLSGTRSHTNERSTILHAQS